MRFRNMLKCYKCRVLIGSDWVGFNNLNMTRAKIRDRVGMKHNPDPKPDLSAGWGQEPNHMIAKRIA